MKAKETKTTLLNGRVTLMQSETGLRASMDTVMLAASVRMGVNESILDMGCGSGGVGFCVLGRLADQAIQLHGVDIQEPLIDLAKLSAATNGWDDQCQFICADINDRKTYGDSQFDHIVCNPPYFESGKRLQSPDLSRETAFGQTDIKVWIDNAHYWLKHKGSLTLIHRADMLDKILQGAGARFGGIEVWPIHSKANMPAIRVVVSMLKNRKTPFTLHPPVVLFNDDGTESDESKRILRGGEGLI